MPNVIKIEGIRELNRSLKDFERDIRLAPTRINREAAKDVAATAKAIVPRRSGRLAGSIKPGASGSTAYVKTGLVYSPVIHFGWPKHNISPNPFLYNALDQRRADVLALYEKRMQELAEKVRGI
jgi:hypothetical protein